MAAETATAKAPRKPVKRLTPAEKRAKAIANIDAELSKATDALMRATQGAFLARDVQRAQSLMGVCEALMQAGLATEDQAKEYGLS